MNRRKFLRNGSAVGLAAGTSLASVNLAASVWPDAGNNQSELTADETDLVEAGIGDLQKMMETGVQTSVSITKWYLRRIERIDKNGPALHSVLELNPDATTIAAQMDSERKSGKVRGPLHGIPVLIKDNINTGDKMVTSAGSLALAANIASRDAFLVGQLRQAGAVILGKTNLSEWANFRSTRSASGWSSRGGQTKNPFILDRTPSGSSSGSGAAVSASLCAVAVGTETNGSIIAPASSCGIVGLKPTVGLISRSGIIPISHTQDTAGPMARTVRDAAILLGALTGTDAEDAITQSGEGKGHRDYTTFLHPDGLRGKRIGFEKSFLQGHEGVVALFREAIGLMEKQGAVMVGVDLLDTLKGIGGAEFNLLQFEFKAGLNAYFQKNKTRIDSLASLIDFNQKNAASVMPWFGQELLEMSQAKGGLEDPEYQSALAKVTSSRTLISQLMGEHQLDAIAGTSIGPSCCIDLICGDYDTGFYFCTPAAMAGFPHITVPMGHLHGLPVGLSLMSGAFTEPLLLGIAYAFEQASRKRIPPPFLKTSLPG